MIKIQLLKHYSHIIEQNYFEVQHVSTLNLSKHLTRRYIVHLIIQNKFKLLYVQLCGINLFHSHKCKMFNRDPHLYSSAFCQQLHIFEIVGASENQCMFNNESIIQSIISWFFLWESIFLIDMLCNYIMVK
jgi:hypothetical protein